MTCRPCPDARVRPDAAVAVQPPFGARAWLIPAAIAGAVFAAYWPALSAGFIWDDDAHVTAAALRSWSGLWRIWSDIGATQQYYPLLHTVFWVEHKLWGSAPLGYHLANIVLHAGAATVLALVLRRLAVPGAVLAALLFAVHPVHVESVAWISEQKNTLSTIFYLASALAYLRFDAGRRRGAYLLSLALFVCALLSKTVTATLPAALLVVAWWRRGRIEWRRDVLPLAPWLVLGASAGLLTAWVERDLIGAEGAAFELAWRQRLLLAGRIGWFYGGKLLWPENLTFVYPRWSIDPGSVWEWLPLGSAMALLVVLWRIRGRTRAPLSAALLFGGSLFPALGFFDVYPFQYSFVADHFQYLASIPVIVVGASLLATDYNVQPARSRRGSSRLRSRRVPGCLLVAALGTLTWHQAHLYSDNETLFRATIVRNPAAWMAYNNLGRELMARKRDVPEAIDLFERAIALRPDYAEAHNNLGLALTQTGRPREAISHLEKSLQLKPSSFQAFNNLGIALASSGRPADALPAFARAAALNPTLPNLHENWARALLLLGRRAEAEERFALAARLRGTAPPSVQP